MDRIKREITVEVNVEVSITETIIPAEIVYTSQCPGLTTIRRDGNTTRQIDFAIQKLFEGYRVRVIDHYGTRQANENLFDKILWRLNTEHEYYTQAMLEVNINKLEIELK